MQELPVDHACRVADARFAVSPVGPARPFGTGRRRHDQALSHQKNQRMSRCGCGGQEDQANL
ncbi:MAG TPA: hypothetical protein VF026_28805 [Ktedonobacteraceae bacterium]